MVSSQLSLAAGMTAGAIEGFITYPTEFIKTQLQLGTSPTPLECIKTTVRTRGIAGLYKGMSALLVGNSLKAGVRFMGFETYKQFLARWFDNTTALVGAGLLAGITEAVLVVTPSETVKTKLIHDQNIANPRFRGLVHAVRLIVKEEGAGGIYRGMNAVIARQGANSAVRMSSYSILRGKASQYYLGNFLPLYVTFGIGSVAGIITVYATQPLDVIKTKMQSIGAAARYKGMIDCATKTITDNGVRALWKGSTPRLGRLIVSGGIVFSVYEKVIEIAKQFDYQ